MGMNVNIVVNGTSVPLAIQGTGRTLKIASDSGSTTISLGQPLVLSIKPGTALADDIVAAFRAEHRYITSINDATPAGDGSIWIHGDRCTTLIPRKALTGYQIEAGVDTELPLGQGLYIDDTCPACRKCS